MAATTKEIFARNFSYYIKKSGKNINQIEKETGISHSFLYEIQDESNKKCPSMKTLDKLANYFEIEVGKFYEIKENNV